MNREALDRFFERGILALILAMVVFAPLAMGAVDVPEFLCVQGLIAGVMLLWALRLAFSPEPRLFWPPICWVVVAFAAYAIGRYLTADIEYIARQELIQTLLYAFLFLAIVNNLTSRESTQIITFTLVFLAAAISCYAIWQFATHSHWVWNLISPYQGRASGTYISPNNFACFLEMILPLALAFLLAGRVKPFTRILLAYAAVAMAGGLAVTFSRGGWVAAAVGVLVLLAMMTCLRQHRLPALAVLVLVLAGGTLFVTKYLSTTLSYAVRIESVAQSGSPDLEFRSQMWKAAEEMWKNHFWFGVGPAHYDYHFNKYRDENVQARPNRAHNDYLNLLADWGTTGGIIVAAGMIAFAVSLGKTWKAVRPDDHDFTRGMSNRLAFFLGGTAALIALAAHSIVDFNLHIPANALIGLTLLGLLTAQLRLTGSDYRHEARLPIKTIVIVALMGGIFYFSLEGYRGGAAFFWQEKGQNADLPLLQRADFLKKSFAIEPENPLTSYQIAELYRIQSFQGDADYETLAETAIKWYSQAMKLNPFDSYSVLGCGICLDWLGRHGEAEPYFSRAEALDPNGYFIVSEIGWHYLQTGDYAAAHVWLQRSLRLKWNDNDLAHSYWDLVESKLLENASGRPVLPPGF